MKITLIYKKESVKISIDKKGKTILSIKDGDLDTYRLAKCLYDGADLDSIKELQTDEERTIFFKYERR